MVEELDLEDEEMSQQLTDVLNKLGALEQELSAAVHHSISTSSTSSSSDSEGGGSTTTAAPPSPTAAAAAAAAAAAVLEPPAAAAAAAAGPLAIEHTVELEALAEAASMGARPDTPVMDVLSVPMVPAPTAAAAAAPAVPAAPAAAAAVPVAVSDPTKLWPLFVLGLSYVHQATSGFALPALLPMVSPDLHLTDFQVGGVFWGGCLPWRSWEESACLPHCSDRSCTHCVSVLNTLTKAVQIPVCLESCREGLWTLCSSSWQAGAGCVGLCLQLLWSLLSGG